MCFPVRSFSVMLWNLEGFAVRGRLLRSTLRKRQEVPNSYVLVLAIDAAHNIALGQRHPIQFFRKNYIRLGPLAIPLNHWTGFIYRQCASAELEAVQLLDRLIGVFRSHFDKAETLGSASHAVRDDADGLHRSDLSKQAIEIRFR